MKQKKNYLDFVPKKNPAFRWELDDDGMVVILIENKGIYNRIAQKLLKKPRVSRITLEKFGSFIWRQIDGTRSVYEISGLVSEEFGEEAEPLIERLVKYLRILQNNRFILF
ncbi:PqqD family protein [Massiliimalia massiliensis]|uniref:PqqD family protein n=1 Tax=Massiliimalia massiliensis TaxID=1852384 RepID=UPI0009852BEE|nr:PqqD family protein [Massiliimalia massiliensis]